jgi:hypothetical protein
MEEEFQQSVMVSEGDVEADEGMPDADQAVEDEQPAKAAEEGDISGADQGEAVRWLDQSSHSCTSHDHLLTCQG